METVTTEVITETTEAATTDTGMNGPILGVIAITEVYTDGQKVAAAAVEYDQAIDAAALSPDAFAVEGRTITAVYANTQPAKAAQGVNGNYVIIELSRDDAGASTLTSGGGRDSSSTLNPVQIAVTQSGAVTTVSGETYAANPTAIANDSVINLVVDDFQQLEFTDSATGITLKYNLYVPEGYDATQSYPLVLFIHDAGVVSDLTQMTLLQGIGGVIWATPEEQAKHPSFVLAPQYSSAIVNDNSEATADLDATVALIQSLESEYNIDENRIYTTGQSMGCMASIALMIKYPDLIAGAMLVAGQWDATAMATLTEQNMWIIVSEGDEKAFPGMNSSTEALEAAGATVSRATWSGLASNEEWAADVSAMLEEGNHIMYTVLAAGTVVPAGLEDNGGNNHTYTWKVAYLIEGVRDWLFTQTKTAG